MAADEHYNPMVCFVWSFNSVPPPEEQGGMFLLFPR